MYQDVGHVRVLTEVAALQDYAGWPGETVAQAAQRSSYGK